VGILNQIISLITKQPISVYPLIRWLLIVGAFGFVSPDIHAFSQIQLSTGTPETVEQQLIQAVTTQFNVNLVVNPFFPDTYNMTLFGTNPNYNPPITTTDLLQNLVTVDSYTYVYGWADGTSYARAQDAAAAGLLYSACTSTMTFAVPPPNVSTTSWVVPEISSVTCQFVVDYISDCIWGIIDSTPTVVPGNWQ